MKNSIITIKDILKILPHKYPFLFIDGVFNLILNKFIRAFKNVTGSEVFFKGHFPKKFVFPGVLIVESMVQAASILILKSSGPLLNGELLYLSCIKNVKFKRTVLPGDQIIIEVFLKKQHRNFFNFQSVSKVKQKVVCQAIITCIRK
ncbi:3-hydroxyacyl-[acyl-carrier-protein] dehydratase FabZ [Buchnera aphidicola (Nipponaphis monzeni)]|uniref:3-hydroxyacyl-[acyl-carrier-protein] dehydratase FabZ n=1 Tax=Buchnera aphidicola (Nipponaphis monzeni) TaxID=2495405 RepID=A0A455TA90_9GAMM|nr:3-hydroxyacyl-ACP dehydratase FabZ [Buchnera aphidicola]BBI01200.1 3-hydroxyacyl-[acyl-carrier-protein] dehydratase FabZ [Buchnera aphidicola (Nipponaphis monzeni)]